MDDWTILITHIIDFEDKLIWTCCFLDHLQILSMILLEKHGIYAFIFALNRNLSANLKLFNRINTQKMHHPRWEMVKGLTNRWHIGQCTDNNRTDSFGNKKKPNDRFYEMQMHWLNRLDCFLSGYHNEHWNGTEKSAKQQNQQCVGASEAQTHHRSRWDYWAWNKSLMRNFVVNPAIIYAFQISFE